MALDTIISSSWPQEEAAGAAGQFGSLFGGIYDYYAEDDDHDHTFGGGLLDISTSTTRSNNNSTYHQVSHESSSVFVNYYSSSYNSPSSRSMMQLNKHLHHWDPKSSPPPEEDHRFIVGGGEQLVESAAAGVGRRKRIRRRKSRSGGSGKNKEELENQRMTHIEVERNRRKQMNQYLAVIRSLMPSSYVQRGDQASIVGGAINFVKQLEQQLQTLELQKSTKYSQPHPFAHFFAFPQYSCHQTSDIGANGSTTTMAAKRRVHPAMAEIEVTLVESQGNIKVLSKKRHSQLLKLVAGLQYNLWLTVLHLNVTTIHDQMVLYTLSVKLEDRCQLSTVDEIADAVNCLLCKIEEESLCSI